MSQPSRTPSGSRAGFPGRSERRHNKTRTPLEPSACLRATARTPPLGVARGCRVCTRNCVGTSERDRYAYDYEKQDSAEQERVGVRRGA
jgi:hypothetical protein